VSRYQNGKTNLDFIGARDSEWQWHQLGHMQICPSLQTNNHASTPPLSFLEAGCPSCRPTNSIKALKENTITHNTIKSFIMCAWSASGLNLRHRQSLGGKMVRHGSKRRHRKNNK